MGNETIDVWYSDETTRARKKCYWMTVERSTSVTDHLLLHCPSWETRQKCMQVTDGISWGVASRIYPLLKDLNNRIVQKKKVLSLFTAGF